MRRTGKKPRRPEYTPTGRERAGIERVLERQANRAPAARFNIEMTAANVASISADHPEPEIGHTILADTLGTGDCESYLCGSGRISQEIPLCRRATDQG